VAGICKICPKIIGLFFMKKKQNIIQFTNKSSFFFFLWLKIVKVNIWVKKNLYLKARFLWIQKAKKSHNFWKSFGNFSHSVWLDLISNLSAFLRQNT